MKFFLSKYIQGKESPAKAYWLMWALPLFLVQMVFLFIEDAFTNLNLLAGLEIFLLLIMGCIFTYGPLIVWRCAKNAATKWGYNLSKGISAALPILAVLRMNAYPMSKITSDLCVLVILMGIVYVALIVFKGAWKSLDKEKLDFWTLPILISATSFIAWAATVTHLLGL
jgi:hypothetical protein